MRNNISWCVSLLLEILNIELNCISNNYFLDVSLSRLFCGHCSFDERRQINLSIQLSHISLNIMSNTQIAKHFRNLHSAECVTSIIITRI